MEERIVVEWTAKRLLNDPLMKKKNGSRSSKKAATNGSISYSGIPLKTNPTLGSPMTRERLTYSDGRSVVYPRRWKVPDCEYDFVLDSECEPGKWVHTGTDTVCERSDYELMDAIRLEKHDGWVEIITPDDVNEFDRIQKIAALIVTGDITEMLTERQKLALGCVKTLIADKMFEGKKWTCKEVAGRAVKLADEMMLAMEATS